MKRHEIPESIRPLFDSYRSEADLSHPEMAPLRDWLSQSAEHRRILAESIEADRQVEIALLAVDVPPHLAESVVREMEAAAREESPQLAETAASPTFAEATASLHRGARDGMARRRITIARLKWAGALLALATSVLLIVKWSGSLQPFQTTNAARDLCRASLAWIQSAESGPWSMPGGPSDTEMAYVPKRILWKQIQTEMGLVDCFRFQMPSGRRVYQFEFSTTQVWGLPDRLPGTPDLPTAGYACSARQQSDRVIVVAVEGDANDYRQYLREAANAAA